MDKKQKIKIALAVCFVVVCGAVYLAVHYGGQGKEQIVLEQKNDEMLSEKDYTDAEKKESTGEDAQEKSFMQENKQDTQQVSEVYVHICGAVATEGVYPLPAGSRLMDGVAAAGGFLDTADTAYHNLAAVLSDGQKVYIPTLDETDGLSVAERLAGTEADEKGASVLSEQSQESKVNINTADAGELMTLSGIGEAKAERILEYREKVGRFQSIEEVKNVSGIGDAMFERIKEFIIAE